MNCDLILNNITYLDVKNKEFLKGNIAIKDGKIVGINEDYTSLNIKDMSGKTLVPGFIDGHIHLESSIVNPEDFAKIVCTHGTTALVTDPHEIANVSGIDGIKWMIQKTKNLPIDVFFVVPSCVPATPFDESAYTLDSKDVEECFNIDRNRVIGLAEVMNYPGVINKDQEVLNKISVARKYNGVIDGHAPGLSGKDLVKYISAGIMSDHECSTLEEAVEKLEVAHKLNQEFYIMIREGTAAKNLNALVGLMNEDKYVDNVMFATDDKHPEDVYDSGHIDNMIRKSISLGIKPEIVYTVASYNAAKYFKLKDYGSIEKDKKASFVILDDIKTCKIDSVYKDGEILTQEKINNWEKNKVPELLDNKIRNSINMTGVSSENFDVSGTPKQVIGLVPGEIITKDMGVCSDYDLDNDIIKVVVIEPHKGTMNTGIAYLKGLGLKEGAIATTVAHDSHYLIIAGTNDDDIAYAANEIAKMKGGKITVKNGKTLSKLSLPISNLMTDESPEYVISKMNELKNSVSVNNGIDPFMNLSFVSLAVIPSVRLLPGGAFNVNEWNFVSEGLQKRLR